MPDSTTPLCVDLDGTLIRSDLLWENFFSVLRRKPLVALFSILHILRGRAVFKDRMARHFEPNAKSVPLNEKVISVLNAARSQGRPVYLVTASNEKLARALAESVNLFDEVYASNQSTNLKGQTKAAFLLERFGRGGFDYIGDSRADLPVWAQARKAYVVGDALKAEVACIQKNFEILPDEKGSPFRLWFKALRIHQWVKNSLIAAPLITAHEIFHLQPWLEVCVAFVAMGMVASGNYLLNDLLDLESDRQNRSKKFRPLASGRIPLPTGMASSIALIACGLLLAFLRGPSLGLTLLVYLGISFAYSFVLKKKMIIDVITLSCLYSIRIIVGGVATGIVISHWLLLFSVYLFLSLALAKRYSELHFIREADSGKKAKGRGYMSDDLPFVGILGVATGMISVLIYTLYITSPAMRGLYENPLFLIFVIPVFIYWIGRLWIITARGQMAEDPVVFVLRDRISILTIGTILILVALASIPGLIETPFLKF